MGSSPARPALWAHTSPSPGEPAASPAEVGCSPNTRVPPLSRTVRPKVRGRLLRDTSPHTTFCSARPTPKAEEGSRDPSGGRGVTGTESHTRKRRVTHQKETAARLKPAEHRSVKRGGGIPAPQGSRWAAGRRRKGREDDGRSGEDVQAGSGRGALPQQKYQPPSRLPLPSVPRPSPLHSLPDPPFPIP